MMFHEVVNKYTLSPNRHGSFNRITLGAVFFLAVLIPCQSALADTDGRVMLHWARDDQTDPLSGKVTLQATASVNAPTGETIQATATCDDGGWAHILSVDEDIEFDVYQGDTPLPLQSDNHNHTTVEYKFDNQDASTATVEQHYRNAATVRVGYSDMSTIHRFGVELTLSNGHTPVVDINPTDPVLRAFTDICEKQYQAHQPASNAAPTGVTPPAAPQPAPLAAAPLPPTPSSPAQVAVRAQVDSLSDAAIALANRDKCEDAGKYSAKVAALQKKAGIDIDFSKNNHTEIEQEEQNKILKILWSIQACDMRASTHIK
jgi:hypothetical protein